MEGDELRTSRNQGRSSAECIGLGGLCRRKRVREIQILMRAAPSLGGQYVIPIRDSDGPAPGFGRA